MQSDGLTGRFAARPLGLLLPPRVASADEARANTTEHALRRPCGFSFRILIKLGDAYLQTAHIIQRQCSIA